MELYDILNTNSKGHGNTDYPQYTVILQSF